jgi:TRAP-type C4-dicarboxylate transport system permease small subunit
MFQTINHVTNRIIEGFALLGGCMLCVMISSTFFESMVRYIGYPTSWTVEFTEYALVYLVFLAISYTEKNNDHIRVDFFINLLPRRIKNYVEIFNYFCIVLLMIVLTYYGVKFFLKSYTTGVLSPTPLRVPVFWVQGILPIGAAVMSIKCFLKFISLIRKR